MKVSITTSTRRVDHPDWPKLVGDARYLRDQLIVSHHEGYFAVEFSSDDNALLLPILVEFLKMGKEK